MSAFHCTESQIIWIQLLLLVTTVLNNERVISLPLTAYCFLFDWCKVFLRWSQAVCWRRDLSPKQQFLLNWLNNLVHVHWFWKVLHSQQRSDLCVSSVVSRQETVKFFATVAVLQHAYWCIFFFLWTPGPQLMFLTGGKQTKFGQTFTGFLLWLDFQSYYYETVMLGCVL